LKNNRFHGTQAENPCIYWEKSQYGKASHLVIVIPPKYAVSDIVRKIKANTSREMRLRFPWIKKIYWRNEFWSVGFFSSTVGVNEDVIKRDVEFQEKVDTGKLQLDFGF
jgi:putative transposase